MEMIFFKQLVVILNGTVLRVTPLCGRTINTPCKPLERICRRFDCIKLVRLPIYLLGYSMLLSSIPSPVEAAVIDAVVVFVIASIGDSGEDNVIQLAPEDSLNAGLRY